MELYKSPKIVVKSSNVHGFGVFTKENLKEGELLEECHLYKFNTTDFTQIDLGITPIVQQYPARIPTNPWVIVLGYGSIFNHSDTPNTFRKGENNLYKFFAKADIAAGSELFINYFD
jgi:SET domain-containing protein